MQDTYMDKREDQESTSLHTIERTRILLIELYFLSFPNHEGPTHRFPLQNSEQIVVHMDVIRWKLEETGIIMDIAKAAVKLYRHENNCL